MARRTKEVTITAEGRDKGKTFLITEMPASQAERWAARALIALVKANPELPEEITQTGMAGVASIVPTGEEADQASIAMARTALAVIGRLEFYELEPLMAEMFGCIRIKEPAITRDLTEDDIEEVATRLTLRLEVLRLHANFSLPVFQPAPGSAPKMDA